MPVPLTETNNVIKHPEGGCPLQVGEGIIPPPLLLQEIHPLYEKNIINNGVSTVII